MWRRGRRVTVRKSWGVLLAFVVLLLVFTGRAASVPKHATEHAEEPSSESSRDSGTAMNLDGELREQANEIAVAASSDDADGVLEMGDSMTQTHVPQSLDEAATSVLSTYKQRGDCVLMNAGFLDLLGNTWSCSVQGDGWVEMNIISSLGEGEGSQITVIRMDAHEWQRELVEMGLEGM